MATFLVSPVLYLFLLPPLNDTSKYYLRRYNRNFYIYGMTTTPPPIDFIDSESDAVSEVDSMVDPLEVMWDRVAHVTETINLLSLYTRLIRDDQDRISIRPGEYDAIRKLMNNTISFCSCLRDVMHEIATTRHTGMLATQDIDSLYQHIMELSYAEDKVKGSIRIIKTTYTRPSRRALLQHLERCHTRAILLRTKITTILNLLETFLRVN
jgi:hypothetical protein